VRLENEPVCCWVQIVLKSDNFRYFTSAMFGQHTVDEWVAKISQNYVTSLQNKACKKWQDVFQANQAMFQHSFDVSKIYPTNLQQAIALAQFQHCRRGSCASYGSFKQALARPILLLFLQ